MDNEHVIELSDEHIGKLVELIGFSIDDDIDLGIAIRILIKESYEVI